MSQSLKERLTSTDETVRRIALIESADALDFDDVETLLVHALDDISPEVRGEAARLLESYESEVVMRGLLNALSDDSPIVRHLAAESLITQKNPLLGHLIIESLDVEDSFSKATLFRSLRELRLSEAEAPAISALSDPAFEVRREAVSVLGWLRSSKALPLLTRLAIYDPDSSVRRVAIGSLGFSQSSEVQSALVQALNDIDWQVREEAVTVIGNRSSPPRDLISALGRQCMAFKSMIYTP